MAVIDGTRETGATVTKLTLGTKVEGIYFFLQHYAAIRCRLESGERGEA